MPGAYYNDTILPYGTLPKDFINLGTILGPFFLGHCFNWGLYGVLALQVYVYWASFPTDRKYIKAVVYGVFLIDTVSMAFITHAGWLVLVGHWGDINILHHLDWTWASLPISTGFVSSIVHHFFAFRIWKLTSKIWPVVIISAVSIVQLLFSIKTGQIAWERKTFAYIRDAIPSVWLGGSMLADVLITGSLIFILHTSSQASIRVFDPSHPLVKRLIAISIETALPTTIVAGAKLILIYTAHDNKHLVFCIVLTRLYSNCMMASLNSRSELFGGSGSSIRSPSRLRRMDSVDTTPNWMSPFSPSKFSTDVEIGVFHETHVSNTDMREGRRLSADYFNEPPSPIFSVASYEHKPSYDFMSPSTPGFSPNPMSPNNYLETQALMPVQPSNTLHVPVHTRHPSQ